MRTLARVAAAIVVGLSLLVAGRIGWVAYAPPPAGRVGAQVAFLSAAIDDGAAGRMQQLFPEGEYFTLALTAIATARTPGAHHVRARELSDRLESPELLATFGTGMVPEHGIFAAGWSLAAAADLAAGGADSTDRLTLQRRAEVVDQALRNAPSGFLEGYPGQYWPCDTVVAASALAHAAVLLDRPDWLTTVRDWRERAITAYDPQLQLLPHRVDADGRSLDGPRGSSQSIIQVFWPVLTTALDGRPDASSWSRFRSAFVVREFGLVGVREYPVGSAGAGDVDSGPLVLGVSASASAVTLAAARAAGDEPLARALDREAELLGVPWQWDGRRRYAFGRLPVGDAFLAWARSRPVAAAASAEPSGPEPLWPVFLVVAALPAVVIVSGWWGWRRRRGTRPVRPGWPG